MTTENMAAMAARESIGNQYQYTYNLIPTVPFVGYVDDRIGFEHKMMKGHFIDKNDCIYKRPEYNAGKWQDQFSSILTQKEKFFNISTKARYQER